MGLSESLLIMYCTTHRGKTYLQQPPHNLQCFIWTVYTLVVTHPCVLQSNTPFCDKTLQATTAITPHLVTLYRSDIEAVQSGALEPLPEEMLLDTALCLEDSQGNGSLRHWSSLGEMMNRQASPASFTIWSPRNCYQGQHGQTQGNL